MRIGLLRLTAVAVLAFAARSDAEAAFCASYFNGGTNCGFATFQQCLESVRGVGGQCGPAPGSAGAERRPADRPEARPRREPERKPATARARETPRREAIKPPQPEPTEAAPPAQIVTPPATDTFAAARALLLSGKYQQAIDVLRALRDAPIRTWRQASAMPTACSADSTRPSSGSIAH
jgi:TolA-binding protein